MERYFLTPELAQRLLAALGEGAGEVVCSLDLGFSQTPVRLAPGGTPPAGGVAEFPDGARVTAGQLRDVAESKRGCFLIEDGRLEPIQIAGEYFYKLIPTDEAPTIEISGIQMHRTTGTKPFQNALTSARAVVRKGDRVLDTCGGLGYTAIAAARLGAAEVISVDVDPNVRAIARQNPWSAEYFASPVIRLVDASSAEFIRTQADGSFDCVMHDPPRFSRAGELYGAEFYGQLARVLVRGGRLFHYTGEPYSKSRGGSFVQGVMQRLRDAGFTVQARPELQGVVGRRQ